MACWKSTNTIFSLKSEDSPVYVSCFLPEKIPIILNLWLFIFPLFSISSNSRSTSSPNFRLFCLANSSWTIIESLSFSPIFLPSLIVNTPLLNKIFLLVLFVASSETTFLNSSDKSSLFILCSQLTTLASFSFAYPSYCIIISSISFNFSISLNSLTLK